VLGAFLVVLAALPPSGGASWARLGADLQLDAGSMDSAVVYSTDGGWLGGGLNLRASIYGRPVTDDDAAPSLQPFLQRTPRFHLEASVGGRAIRSDQFRSPTGMLVSPPARRVDFGLSLSGEGYVRWLYLAGGLDLQYFSWDASPPAPELLIHPSLTLGVRWGEILLFAGWGLTAYRYGEANPSVNFWGGAFIGGHAVLTRWVDVSVSISVLDHGAIGAARSTLWLRRRLGLGLGIFGGSGRFSDSPLLFDRVGGDADISYWIGPRVAVSVAYAPTWTRAYAVPAFGSSAIRHLLTFSVDWRPQFGR
jgi:hypothetical protein